MISNPINLSFHSLQSVASGYTLQRDVTAQLKNTWRRSVRDIGGYWIGTAQWEGSPGEMLDIFQKDLMTEIQETTGGMITWQGFLAEMALVHQGQRYVRSWLDVANRVKVVYSLMGVNLLTNPGCETTVWDAYGTPTTRERSTTWVTQGDYSAHVITDAANEGVVIQSSIGIAAANNYQGRVTVNIVSGVWRLEIYRTTDDEDVIVDYSDQTETGQSVITVGISDDNLEGGTVGLRLYCTDDEGEVYADAAVFQRIAYRAETGWYQNARSQARYGIIEHIVSQIGMTPATANALAQTTLANKAWARIKAQDQYSDLSRTPEDKLELTFLGYVYTLRNKYTFLGGTEDDANEIITNLIGEAQFVTLGKAQANTMTYYIEDIEQYRAWDLIYNIIKAGDASANRWVGGVYAGKRFYYEQASALPVARIRNGKIIANNGGMLEGWLAEPGLIALDDMPVAYDIGERPEDSLNKSWMNEVEFNLNAYLQGGSGITYRRTE